MGTGYAKTDPTNFVDGETIEASDFTTEFNAIDASFHLSTGHTHDGTTAEGGPVTKLLGTAITIGDATSGTDIAVTFDGESNDGVLTWMEDEDYFKFSDDVLMNSTEKLYFRDTAIYLNSSADGQLDLVADTEIQIAATTVDINGNVDISGTLTVAGALDFGDAALSNVGDVQLDSIAGDGDTNTSITFSGSDVITIANAGTNQITFNDGSILPVADNDIDLGSSSYEFKDGYFDGTLYADAINFNGTAISSTAAELNIVDGGTSATSTTVADADRVVLNDNGTMVQVAVTDLAAYFDDEITAMPNLVTTAATTVGALNSGSITSGFGTIDTGSSTITTTGLITGGSLDIDNVLINGTTIGHTDDTDLITLADGVVTVAGELDATTLDISGNADIDGTTNLDAVDIDGAVQIDATVTVGVDDQGYDVKFFGDTASAYVMWDTSADKLLTAGGATVDIVKDKLLIGGTAVTTTAAELNVLDAVTAGTVTASLGVVVDSNKDIGSFRNITLTGELDAGSLDISGDADIDGTLEADAITVGGTTLAEYISDTAGAMVGSNTETGVTVTYQDSDNTIDFAIDAAQTTITSIYATDLIMGEDSQTAIDFGTANEIDFKVDNAARLTLTSGALYPVTDNQIDLGTSSLEFKDAFFDGTVTSDAFAGPLTGDVTGTSSKVTVSDSTANTNFPVVFHDESDALLDDTGALRYNPSSGTLLVPNLSVAGTTTTVDTVTMEAANAVIFEGATADGNETTLSIVDPTADHTQYLINQGGYIPVLAAATTTAITSTPAELNILDGVTSTAAELNILDGVTSTTAEINLIDGGTARGTTAVASGDGILINDGGTMRMTNVDTVSTYFSSHNVGGGNIVTTGALNSGSITSGFGAIDNGSSNITTTGDISGGTVNATSDTAAGDNAAIGYTSGEGLILTGQGSTSDLTVKNDADATVFTVPTGTDDILFPDGAKAMWGAASDLTIHHDGSNSYISDTGTGGLYILANVFSVNNAANSEAQVIASQDGAVTLYHNGLAKLNTETTGISVGASGVNSTIKTHSAGTSNLTLGVNAGNTIESGGNYNVCLGDEAGTAITTGDNNTLVGYGAGDAMTTPGNNTAVGFHALGAVTDGFQNVAIGSYAGDAITEGDNNVALGHDALGSVNTANDNVGIGSDAGGDITTGYHNVLVGSYAGNAITTGINNVAVGYDALGALTTTSGNIAIGKNTLDAGTDGIQNCIAIGYDALTALTASGGSVGTAPSIAIGFNCMAGASTGTNNIAIGAWAMDHTVTGSANVAIGNSAATELQGGGDNVIIGQNAGAAITTGGDNVAVGAYALDTNTTAGQNVAIGKHAMGLNVDGTATAVGYNCLGSQTTGTNNVAMGNGAGSAVTSGSTNTIIGQSAGDAITTGSNHVAVGHHALSSVTTAGSLTGIGTYAGQDNTSGSDNTYLGYVAGQNVTTGANNTAIGSNALMGDATNNNTGNHNVAVGYQALKATTTAQFNIGIGKDAGLAVTTGSGNTLIGYHAADVLTTGGANVALGRNALGASETSSDNTGIGDHALVSVTTGGGNAACGQAAGDAITSGATNSLLGQNAGTAITTGNSNVCLGNTAGSTLTTGTNNIMIGLTSKGSAVDNDHELVIGCNDLVGKGDNTGVIGPATGAMYQINNSASFSTTSDRRIKKNIVDNSIGLDAINQLQVRNFEYRTPDEITELPKHAAINKEGIQLGVIAQEIQPVLPDVVKEESTGCLTVDPDNMTWYLVNAVKELSTQVDELRAEIKTLKGE